MVRSILTIVLSVSVLCVSLYSTRSTKQASLVAASELRKLRVEQQDAELYVHTLNNGQTLPLLRVLGEDVTSLQVRLAEFLSGSVESGGAVVAYEQSLLGHSVQVGGLPDVPVNSDVDIQIIRLDVQTNLAHAPALVSLLSQLKASAGGWPANVRACDVQRVPTQQLRVQCVVDIYYWQAEA